MLTDVHKGGKQNLRSLVDMCEEQLKQCRRLRSLYISIRRGLKRRHRSCTVAFSSFKLSTDPIVSCEMVKKAARLCAPQVLASCQLHIAEHDFIQAMAWLAQQGIKLCLYSGEATSSFSSFNIDSKAFFQWLCLGRYADSICMPI